MRFNTTHTTKGRCAICAKSAARRCQNCHVSHCDTHMLKASCAGCTATLWGLARRRTNQIKIASLFAGGAAMGASIALAPFSTVPLFAFAIFVAVSVLVPKAASALVGRSLAKRQLPKSSVPLQLPAASEVSVPSAGKKESAYDIRRRRNKSRKGRGSGGGIRAVFMTRGGHFYQ